MERVVFMGKFTSSVYNGKRSVVFSNSDINLLKSNRSRIVLYAALVHVSTFYDVIGDAHGG